MTIKISPSSRLVDWMVWIYFGGAKMKKFKIEVQEILSRIVEVEAKNLDEAFVLAIWSILKDGTDGKKKMIKMQCFV